MLPVMTLENAPPSASTPWASAIPVTNVSATTNRCRRRRRTSSSVTCFGPDAVDVSAPETVATSATQRAGVRNGDGVVVVVDQAER